MKKISTRHLLIVLLLVGISAIAVLSGNAILTGKRFAENNENLVAVALPLQAANTGITSAVLDFIERQRSILSARSLGELDALAANVELKQHFDQEREKLQGYSRTVPDVAEIMIGIDSSFQEFFSADQALFRSARSILTINDALLLRVAEIQNRVAQVQKVTEAINGKVNLAIKRSTSGGCAARWPAKAATRSCVVWWTSLLSRDRRISGKRTTMSEPAWTRYLALR